MTYITRIANKRILAKYFLYSLQINYLHWNLSASRSIFSCYATFVGLRLFLNLVIVGPAILNILSEGTEVAGIQRSEQATPDSL